MCHVLIIEDELLVAMHIQAVLEESGATSVEVATTERQAVEAALAKTPGVITSDINLAEGSGLKAIEAIHAQAGPIPVIFITGVPEECRMSGPHVRVLAKPLSEAAVRGAFLEMFPG